MTEHGRRHTRWSNLAIWILSVGAPAVRSFPFGSSAQGTALFRTGFQGSNENSPTIRLVRPQYLPAKILCLLTACALALLGGASNASAQSCVGTFMYTDSIVTCMVPTTGNYSITALGAQGGTGAAGLGGERR
jgi:hypothetical protein